MHYLVVDKASGNITSVVQRTSEPHATDRAEFVLADGILLPIYYRLLSEKSVVSLKEVLDY